MAARGKIIIVGAGEAGRMVLRDLRKTGRDRAVVGFVDDDAEKRLSIIDGKRILAPTKEFRSVLKAHEPDEVIIAMPSVDPSVINRIVSDITKIKAGITVHIIPSAERFFDNTPIVPSLQTLSFEDLMDRPEYVLDSDAIRERFAGKRILITGAGGSIGSELCSQILKFDVSELVALGRGEASLYNLARHLGEYAEYLDVSPRIRYRVCDVRDTARLGRLFREYRPDFVFHAAAHKHVPLMEFNEAEAISNNVGGTDGVLSCCALYPVEGFILVSTDKAVRPANVMGATKRLAELVAGYYHREKGTKTSIVRFGNVIGSRGSVVPLFTSQIERGGPVTVTHPDVTRYFMSIPEASLLVINAAAYSDGGEVFALDMGQPHRLADVAARLIEFYGYRPGVDIEIKYTGLRPGEKLYEELFYSPIDAMKTGNDRIFLLNSDSSRLDKSRYDELFNRDMKSLHDMDGRQLREMLRSYVAEYTFEYQSNPGEERLVN